MRFLVTVLDAAGDRHLIVVDDYTERGAKHRAAASFYLDPKGRRPVSVTVQRVNATVPAADEEGLAVQFGDGHAA